MTSADEIWIGDKGLSEIARFLPHIRMSKTDDGGYRLDAEAPTADAEPFHRALSWFEADLMREDAESLEYEPASPIRTTEQRCADALVELMTRIVYELKRARDAA